MSSMQEDIQVSRKGMEENIMISINEGPFQMGTGFRCVLLEELWCSSNKSSYVLESLKNLSTEEKERYKADIRAIQYPTSGVIPKGCLQYTLNLNTSVKSKDENIKDTTRFERVNTGDQLYAYLKQHEVHANENRIMMERFSQPNNNPLALVSDASVQQYPKQSSKSPQPTKEPSPADNFQLTQEVLNRTLIESLSNTLALLTQSYKSHLPQTNNQLRASSNARNKAMVQDGKVVVQDVRGRYNATNQGRPFQRNNARGNGFVAGNWRLRTGGGTIQSWPKRLQDSDYFKDKMLLMQAQESGAVLDEEQSLFSSWVQYVEDNEEHVVQCNASSVRNDALMFFDEMND
ncbi:hypothetical protein Tco_0775185 [Tanacetum coccineum]